MLYVYVKFSVLFYRSLLSFQIAAIPSRMVVLTLPLRTVICLVLVIQKRSVVQEVGLS